MFTTNLKYKRKTELKEDGNVIGYVTSVPYTCDIEIEFLSEELEEMFGLKILNLMNKYKHWIKKTNQSLNIKEEK